MMDELVRMARLLEKSPGIYEDEYGLQAHVADLFGPSFEREVTFGGNRFDLWRSRDGVVVEVKVTGTPSVVRRQLVRYASTTGVQGILLATTRASHAWIAGSWSCDVPLVVARLWTWGVM